MFGGTHEHKFASTLANYVHMSLSLYFTTNDSSQNAAGSFFM